MQCLVILHLGWTCFLKLNVNKTSKVGHGDLFLICDTPLRQDELGTKIWWS